jgi:hypothetical protein
MSRVGKSLDSIRSAETKLLQAYTGPMYMYRTRARSTIVCSKITLSLSRVPDIYYCWTARLLPFIAHHYHCCYMDTVVHLLEIAIKEAPVAKGTANIAG